MRLASFVVIAAAIAGISAASAAPVAKVEDRTQEKYTGYVVINDFSKRGLDANAPIEPALLAQDKATAAVKDAQGNNELSGSQRGD